VFQQASRYGRQCARLRIALLPRRGDVDLRKVLGNNFVGQELWIGPQASVDALGHAARERGAAFLECQIDIDHAPAEEKVPSGTTNEIRTRVLFGRPLADEIESPTLRIREIVEGNHRRKLS